METESPKSKLFSKQPDRTTLILRWVVGLLLAAMVLTAALSGLAYAMSPAAIRAPESTHYHFRMQIVNNGKPVNFADKTFQTPLNHDICTAKLTKEPVHFHDQVDQFVHVHWAHITGTLLLKNYGWNFDGGLPGSLGYRFDKLPAVTNVPIHGNVLPPAPKDSHYYIFTGNERGYRERDWSNFLNEDLNMFFGHPTVSAPARGWWDLLVPAASATTLTPDDAGGNPPDQSATPTPATSQKPSPSQSPHVHPGSELQVPKGSSNAGNQSQEELAEVNHVLGNVVIFAQKDRPQPKAIQDRFNKLVAVPQSTCGG